MRGETSFRMAERLHRAGLIEARPTKWNWAGGRRPFRELELTRPGKGNPNLLRMPHAGVGSRPMRYHAWQILGETVKEIVLTPQSVPCLVDPDPESPTPTLLYSIDAATWEEAQAVHHLRQGFKPYQPGPASECPTCQAVVYDEGSGACWRCNGQ